MKSFEELFNEFNNNTEVINLGNEAYKEIKKRNKLTLLLCAIIDFVIIGIMCSIMGMSLSSIPFYIFTIFIIDIIIFFIMVAEFNSKHQEFNLMFKEQIIKKMISNFYNNTEYYPRKKMPQAIYDEAKYDGRYNKYYSDDYIEATINEKYFINIAEVHTKREETRTDSDGNTHTTTYTVFNGIFAKITMEKSINQDLRITSYDSYYNHRLEMDSVEFEKQFDVFASNKIIGMQLLTADIMEELVEFKNRINQKFDVFIDKNNIYLRFHCDSMFEPSLVKKQILNEKKLKSYYDILKFTYELSNKIINIIESTEI